MAKKNNADAPKFGPPDPEPKVGDVIEFVRPAFVVTEETDPKAPVPEPVVTGKVAFVHPKLEGRVVNVEVAAADGTTGIAVNVPYYPAEVMEEEDVTRCNTWHWPAKK